MAKQDALSPNEDKPSHTFSLAHSLSSHLFDEHAFSTELAFYSLHLFSFLVLGHWSFISIYKSRLAIRYIYLNDHRIIYLYVSFSKLFVFWKDNKALTIGLVQV